MNVINTEAHVSFVSSEIHMYLWMINLSHWGEVFTATQVISFWFLNVVCNELFKPEKFENRGGQRNSNCFHLPKTILTAKLLPREWHFYVLLVITVIFILLMTISHSAEMWAFI